jgi:hypothetical protein
VRSYAVAEKDDEGMALKILTQAKDMPDGKDKLKSYAYTKWKRAPLFSIEPMAPASAIENDLFD